MNIHKLNLKYNPFEILTLSASDTNLVWAGMELQKKLIKEVYKEGMNFNPRQVTLNWGQLGGGKTHAAYYFERNISTILNIDDDKIFHVHVNIPEEGKDANKGVIKNIFDNLSLRKIKQEISTIRKEIGKEKLFELINRKVKSETLSNAVLRLNEEIISIELLQRFVFDGLSSAELKKLHLPSSLKSNEEYVTFLAAVLIAMTSGKDEKRVVLWIDEMESMVYYNSKQFRAVSQVFRGLIDRVNEKLLIFFNFTLTDNELETVRLLLGDALWSRLNKKIRFEILSLDDAAVYCKDAINQAQIDGSKKLSPFTNDSVEIILKTIPVIDLIPREINR